MNETDPERVTIQIDERQDDQQYGWQLSPFFIHSKTNVPGGFHSLFPALLLPLSRYHLDGRGDP